MNISLPDPMKDYVQTRIDDGDYASISDYVRDLIRRDQDMMDDEERWLRELDASIAVSVAEMTMGAGIDVDAACDAALAAIGSKDARARP